MQKYKVLLNYGTMAGIAGFVAFAFYYAMGYNPIGNISWLTAWIPIVFIYLGTKNHREQMLGGSMTFGQGFLAGMLITLIWATLAGMLAYLFGAVIDSSFVELAQEEAYEQIEQARGFMGDNLVEVALSEVEKMTLGSMIQGDVFNKLFGGVFISLIIAAINKRKVDFFESTEENV